MQDEKNVQKMIDIISKVQQYVAGNTYEDFINNEMLVEACVFNLSQLGETSHRISDDIVEANRDIAWHEMYGLRNKLVHDYEGTNPKLVWEIITEDLPKLKTQLSNIF